MIRIPLLDVHEPYHFPPVTQALDEPNGLLAMGGDLAPARLLAAYQCGIFPWFSHDDPILWWSPDPRMVLATHDLHVPQRLRRWLKTCHWQLRTDTAFADVVKACAAPRVQQPNTWITDEMFDAYTHLHRLGYAHSIEVYHDAQLIGGIYGVAIGHMFFGESMFSRSSNASKVALLTLAHLLAEWGYPLIDAQVPSPHLYRLGGFEMPRHTFCAHVKTLTAQPSKAKTWDKYFPSIIASELLY